MSLQSRSGVERTFVFGVALISLLVSPAVAKDDSTQLPCIGMSRICQADLKRTLTELTASAAGEGNINYMDSYSQCKHANHKVDGKAVEGMELCIMGFKSSADQLGQLATAAFCSNTSEIQCLPEGIFALKDFLTTDPTEYAKRCHVNETEAATTLDDVKSFIISNNLTTLFGGSLVLERSCGNHEHPLSQSAGGVIVLMITIVLVLLGAAALLVDYFAPESPPSHVAMNTNDEHVPLIAPGVKPAKRKSKLLRMLKMFDPKKNLGELFATSPARSLGGLDGMRSFSMLWIILAHTSLLSTFLGEIDPYTEIDVLETWNQQFVLAAQYGVDTFFFISGMLTAYTMTNRLRKRNIRVAKLPSQTLLFMFLRFLRLTPVYAFDLFLYAFLLPTLSSGPFWYRLINESNLCKNYWWTNMLYFNNFYPSEFHNTCMSWSWYLANDMQFFFVALMILFIYVRSKNAGLTVCAVITIGSTIGGYFIAEPLTQAEFQNQYYDKPYTRIPPLTAGMFLGFLLRDTELKNRKLSPMAAFSWMSSTVVLLLTIAYITLGHYKRTNYDDSLSPPDTWGPQGSAAYSNGVIRACLFYRYDTFGRLGFILCIFVICGLNASGNGGVVYSFLTMPFWEPMGKLTFGAYLIHPAILRVFYFSQEELFQFDVINQTMIFIGTVGLSYGFAMFTYSMIELPFDGLVKMGLKLK